MMSFDFIYSNLPWFWLAVLVACIVIEGITLSLTTVWGAIASLPLIFISKTGLLFKWQLLIFVGLTVVLIVFTRPFAVKKLKIGKKISTNVEAMEGQEVLVIKPISRFEKGEVKARNGVVWTAAVETDGVVQSGAVCTVKRVEGNTLVVMPKVTTGIV